MLVPLKWLAALISAIASLLGGGTKGAPAPAANQPARTTVYRTASASNQPGFVYKMRLPGPPSGRAVELSSTDSGAMREAMNALRTVKFDTVSFDRRWIEAPVSPAMMN